MFQLRIRPEITENETITAEPGLDLEATSTSAAIDVSFERLYETFKSEPVFTLTKEERIPHASEDIKSAKEGSEKNLKTKHPSEYDGINDPSSKNYRRFIFPLVAPQTATLTDDFFSVPGTLKSHPKMASSEGKNLAANNRTSSADEYSDLIGSDLTMGSDDVFYNDVASDSVELDELITFSIGEGFIGDRSSYSDWNSNNDDNVCFANGTITFRLHKYSTDSESEASNWKSDNDGDHYFFGHNGSARFHKNSGRM